MQVVSIAQKGNKQIRKEHFNHFKLFYFCVCYIVSVLPTWMGLLKQMK